jgi:hypothetical protein
MGSNGSTLIFAAVIVGVAIYFGHTTINNTNEQVTENDQTTTVPSGGGGGGNPLAAILGFL